VKRSLDRILTTHAGALEQPEWLRQALAASGDRPHNDPTFRSELRQAVAEIVRKQADCGIDIVNDGEFGKENFHRYVARRIAGYEWRPIEGETEPPWASVLRDANDFRPYYEKRGNTLFGRGAGLHTERLTCVAPLSYTGRAELQIELDNFRSALEGVQYEEAFLPAPGPSTLSQVTVNAHYQREEDFLFALAEAIRPEYQAIVEAGFCLQVDDPHLAMAWQELTDMSVAQYQAYTEVRVEAINRALRGIPPDRVRLHTCWGSWVGPHTGDIALEDIIHILYKVNADGLSTEAANPRHEHEWEVFERAPLPDGKILIPGVLSHFTDFVEHPKLVAQRLVRYARIAGRENVVAGTDCGLRRVGHPDIAWAKFRAMAEGARLASQELWS